MLLQIQESLNFLLIIFEWEQSKTYIATHLSYFRKFTVGEILFLVSLSEVK